MRNVVLSAMLAAALTGTAVSTAAQTMQAVATTSRPLYKGLTMKAEQHCPRFPGQGVTFKVESVNQSGTGGDVSVQVECWGSTFLIGNGRYGSIAVEGTSVKLRFYSWTNQYGADLSGTWQTDAAGRPMLVFGRSELRSGRSLYTDELVFR